MTTAAFPKKAKALCCAILMVNLIYMVLIIAGVPPFVMVNDKIRYAYADKLDIEVYNAKDCDKLKYFRLVKDLKFCGNDQTNVDFLSDMPRLQKLFLYNITFDKLNNVMLGENLKELTMFDVDVRDLRFLKNAEKLSELCINNVHIEYLSDYDKYEEMNYMIRDIDSIQFNREIESLELAVCSDTNLSALKSLKKLKKISLYTNNTDLSSVYQSDSIEQLILRNGSIKQFDGIEKLKTLKDLRLSTIDVKDFTFLSKCSNLETLYLSNENGYGDLGFLKDMTNLNEVHIYVMNDDSFNELESALKARNVNIYVEHISKNISADQENFS